MGVSTVTTTTTTAVTIKRTAKGFCRSHCEICGTRRPADKEGTLCEKCTSDLVVLNATTEKRRAGAWAAEHKCRQCGRPLAINRYFRCRFCLEASNFTRWGREEEQSLGNYIYLDGERDEL